MKKNQILILLIFIQIVACKNNRKEILEIQENEKINLIEIQDVFDSKGLDSLITINKIEYSKIKDPEDNCFVYHHSNNFFSDKNIFKGAISSDTYEYYDKEKNDIKRFFKDSLLPDRKFENFDFVFDDSIQLEADNYSVHKVLNDGKLTGYAIAILIDNKIIRSQIVFVENLKHLSIEKLNKKIQEIKTMPNNG